MRHAWFVFIGLLGGGWAAPYAHPAALTNEALGRLSASVDQDLSRYPEFQEIQRFGEESGARIYLLGGSAVSILRRNLERSSKAQTAIDSPIQIHDLFSFVQDYDLVIEGPAPLADQLKQRLALRFPYKVQRYKSKWDVISLESLTSNPDFRNQNTDTLSGLLFELTPNPDPPKRYRYLLGDADPYGVKNPAIEDLIAGQITFLPNPHHRETSLYNRGRNPEVISVLRVLGKQVNYGLTLNARATEEIAGIMNEYRRFSNAADPLASTAGLIQYGEPAYGPGRAHNLLVQFFLGADDLAQAFQVFMQTKLYRVVYWILAEGEVRQIPPSQRLENLIPFFANLGPTQSFHPRHYRQGNLMPFAELTEGSIIEGTLLRGGDKPDLFFWPEAPGFKIVMEQVMHEMPPSSAPTPTAARAVFIQRLKQVYERKMGERPDVAPGFSVSMGEYVSGRDTADVEVAFSSLLAKYGLQDLAPAHPSVVIWKPIREDPNTQAISRLRQVSSMIASFDEEDWNAFQRFGMDRYFIEWPLSQIQAQALTQNFHAESELRSGLAALLERNPNPAVRKTVQHLLTQYFPSHEGSACAAAAGSRQHTPAPK